MELSDIIENIEDSAVYTVEDIVTLAGCSDTSVRVLVNNGVLPRRSSKPYAWTGQEVRKAAARQRPDATARAHLSDETRYRHGDRDLAAILAHNASTTQWRREIADAAFSAAARERVLKLIAAGVQVADAAAVVGVSLQQVYGRALRDEEFAARLDEAAEALCIDSSREQCGSPSRYRDGCRATECRRAPAARARQERGTPRPAPQHSPRTPGATQGAGP